MPNCLNMLVYLVVGGLAVGCQTSPEISDGQAELAATPVVSQQPVLPQTFAKTASKQVIEVPVEMIDLSEVSRPRAPIRSGPEAHLPLTDWMLKQGDRVLTFDRVGRWVRVLDIATGHRGWLHEAVLKSITIEQPETLTLDSALLPTAFAHNRISSVRSYDKKTEVKAKIPRGAAFRALMIGKRQSLVLVPQTNAAVWIDRKDVQ